MQIDLFRPEREWLVWLVNFLDSNIQIFTRNLEQIFINGYKFITIQRRKHKCRHPKILIVTYLNHSLMSRCKHCSYSLNKNELRQLLLICFHLFINQSGRLLVETQINKRQIHIILIIFLALENKNAHSYAINATFLTIFGILLTFITFH